MPHFIVVLLVWLLWYMPSFLVTWRYILKLNGEVRLFGLFVCILLGLFGWANVFAWFVVVGWEDFDIEWSRLNPVVQRASK